MQAPSKLMSTIEFIGIVACVCVAYSSVTNHETEVIKAKSAEDCGSCRMYLSKPKQGNTQKESNHGNKDSVQKRKPNN